MRSCLDGSVEFQDWQTLKDLDVVGLHESGTV